MGAYRADVRSRLRLLVGLFTVGVGAAIDAPAEADLQAQAKPKRRDESRLRSAGQEGQSTRPQKSAPPRPAPAPQRRRRQPTLLGQFGDWGAYTANSGGTKVCYALAKPASQATQPPNRPRDPAYIFISTRPAENVRNEISIVIGYPFKPGYEASVDIGSAKYAMYTQDDGAWMKNPAEEARMVDAMRKGADLVVSGESGRGTKSTDRYTLHGLGAGARPRRAGVQIGAARVRSPLPARWSSGAAKPSHISLASRSHQPDMRA